MMGDVDPSTPSVLLHWLPTSCTTCSHKKGNAEVKTPPSHLLWSDSADFHPPKGDGRHLEPALGLLFALDRQHQGLATRQREAQLVPLLASLLGDVDDVAEVERELRVGGALFDALEALRTEREASRGHRVETLRLLHSTRSSLARCFGPGDEGEWFPKHQVEF